MKQSVAAHSWGVAMLLLEEAPKGVVTLDLIRAALTHDLHESVLGDVPSPAKTRFPELYDELVKAEGRVDRERGWGPNVQGRSPEQRAWLRWADAEEARRWVKWVAETFGFPEAVRLEVEIRGQADRLLAEAKIA